jgi:hypothetical protein
MKTIKPTTRRKFLLAASLGSAGAVAAVATQQAAKPASATSPDAPDAKETRYRLTEHIQQYYNTTKV